MSAYAYQKAVSLVPANASLTFAGDTNFDQNGRYARQTVTFADGAQAYLDVYDTAISGTTTARAAQIDIRLTTSRTRPTCRSPRRWRCSPPA